jgi:hypothetical protein
MKYKHIWDECMSGQPDNGLIFDQRLGVTIDICGIDFRDRLHVEKDLSVLWRVIY